MIENEIVIQQNVSQNRQVANLPDGSTAVFDTATQTIHSLNPVAAVAYRLCHEKIAFSELLRRIPETLNTDVTEAAGLQAISELERAGLVACSTTGQETEAGGSRRSLLRVAGSAIPFVLSLTSLEQSAFAQGAGSGTIVITGTSPAVSLSAISPQVGGSCGSVNTGASITGHNTHFSSSSVVTFSNTGVTASNVTVNSPTSISLTITTANGAAEGHVTVTVVTSGETAVGANLFSVQSCV